MSPIPTLRTPRLILRPFQSSDAAELCRIQQIESVLRYFPNPVPPPLERVERYLAGQQAHWEQYGYGNWAVEPDKSGRFAGWAGLQYLPETNEIEVGYLLDPAVWGKGYATEAARASLQWGFDHFPFPEIIALVHPENTASLRVAAKCGLIPVERKVYWGLELVRHTVTRETLIGA